MCARVGVSDPTRDLLGMLVDVTEEGEDRDGFGISWLFLESCEIDGPSVEPRWGAGLKTTLWQGQLA
jgi:hypothetical protein